MDKHRPHTFWTDEQRIQLADAWRDGRSLKDLAMFHGVSPTAIRQQISQGHLALIRSKKDQLTRLQRTNIDLEIITRYPQATHQRLEQTMHFLRKIR
jgi:predicted DNA-binding protein YlxM (UPF0122 family)